MKMSASIANSQQKGFTLIELVVVIVILGILAATAAPKFIDLTGDAKASVMKGVEASIESAVSLAHAKALIAGKTNGDDFVKIDNKYYKLFNGYPAAKSDGDGTAESSAIGILGLLDIDSSTDGSSGDFKVTDADTTIIQHISEKSGNECRLTYKNSAGANQRPVIDSTSLSGC